jgi:hypothetical protein
MIALYGLKLNLTRSGASYFTVNRQWTATPGHPMTFKTEEEAEAEALRVVAMDSDLFGRISVIRLIPGVNQWFVA